MFPIDFFWRAAQRWPDRIAIDAHEGAIRYDALAARVTALAAGFTAIDPTPQSRVGICAGNSADHIAALLAVLACGKVWVPLNPKSTRPEIRRIIDATEPTLLVLDAACADLLEGAPGARVLTGSEKILVTLSRKDNPQAVISAFRQRTTNLSDFPATGPRRWLALYEVRDPGNLGTVIRTADAAGCDGVILIGQTCDPFSVEAVRASMGSIFAVPFATADFEEFNAWRTGAGARMIAASMRGTHAHDKATFGERSVILMGNEQSGLPPEVEDKCDELVRIPMMGKADSLNLAIAASVMTYEAWRAAGYKGANR